MAVDHLPVPGIELEDLVEIADATEKETSGDSHKVKAPEAAPEAADDESWPQTGFGSFP